MPSRLLLMAGSIGNTSIALHQSPIVTFMVQTPSIDPRLFMIHTQSIPNRWYTLQVNKTPSIMIISQFRSGSIQMVGLGRGYRILILGEDINCHGNQLVLFKG